MADLIKDSYVFGGGGVKLQAQYENAAQTLPSGRKIYRHSSNEGSVIEFDYWGTPMKLFVADAKYRATNLAYDTTHQQHGNPELPATTEYFNGSQDSRTEALSYTKNDAWIQSTYPYLRKDGTAKSNTDNLMAYSTTVATHHCRKQNISGVGQLDLPNLYETIILYLESDNIDALDPSAESSRDKALGMMNTYGRFDLGGSSHVWSSTGYNSKLAWFAHYWGCVRYDYQNFGCGVAPVKELSIS